MEAAEIRGRAELELREASERLGRQAERQGALDNQLAGLQAEVAQGEAALQEAVLEATSRAAALKSRAGLAARM
eukprot:5212711-Prymnesium_polylepis.4